MVESNELTKKDFSINRDSIPLQEQKQTNKQKKFINLLKKGLLIFRILKKRINRDNLIYKYKTEGRSLKHFRDYKNLFKNLRYGNINSKEILKNRNNFESNLGKIKKIPDLKSKYQISVIQNVENVFDLF